MAFKLKDSSPAPFVPKRTISITEARVVNGSIVDEDGDIVSRILEKLPSADTEFSIKVIAALPDEGNEEV